MLAMKYSLIGFDESKCRLPTVCFSQKDEMKKACFHARTVCSVSLAERGSDRKHRSGVIQCPKFSRLILLATGTDPYPDQILHRKYADAWMHAMCDLLADVERLLVRQAVQLRSFDLEVPAGMHVSGFRSNWVLACAHIRQSGDENILLLFGIGILSLCDAEEEGEPVLLLRDGCSAHEIGCGSPARWYSLPSRRGSEHICTYGVRNLLDKAKKLTKTTYQDCSGSCQELLVRLPLVLLLLLLEGTL
jgi:hypothetical protein